MKAFNRIPILVLMIAAIIFAVVNVCFAKANDVEGRQYRVDASRAAAVIESRGINALDISQYPSLAGVTLITADEITDGEYDYLIKNINGSLYRFDYVAQTGIDRGLAAAVNISIAVMTAAVIAIVFYLRRRVIKPFYALRDMPYELSKGNLTMPLKEDSQRYFGRFVWGMDMLREKLEQNKQNELELQAERKKLILSLSHDIKIPLSAIKLYSKAISKGLYDGEERQSEIAEKINEKADEIERYVSQIVTASREDFLALEVNEGEFYLSELLDGISLYYGEKLRMLKTNFCVSEYRNCLISGDRDRAVDVIQNIMENAIKYGDGKSIEISVSDEEGCRLITVANTGCTLPKSEMPHMFDSFWRGTNAGGEPGSGLGLYICRNLMNKMGGEVFAQIKDGKMYVTAVFRPA